MLALSKRVSSPVFQVISRSYFRRHSDFLVHISPTATPNTAACRAVLHRAWNRNSLQTACCGSGFRTYSTEKELKKTPETGTTGSENARQDATEGTTSRTREPTDFEKRLFVWTGRYKTVEEVPRLVSEAALMSIKSKMRIYVNVGMGAATLIAAIFMIIIGKSRAKQGDSLSKRNVSRHPEHYGTTMEGGKPQSE